MRILIVDDSREAGDFVEALLVDAGYKDIVVAESATAAFEALALASSPTPEPVAVDLVLLDIVMPTIDGIEACARIRNDPRYSDVPIIMVTSLKDMDSLANAFLAGATDYIMKPVVRIELLARVRAALKLKGELDRRKAREQELAKRISHPDEGHWHLIDDVTGLFVGEVAEAYLTSAVRLSQEDTSVIALLVDRIEAYRSTQGEVAAKRVIAQVARTVRATVATVGVFAAAYRNGVIVLIVPAAPATLARALGETLRVSVAALAIDNEEAISSDHVTASVAVVIGRAGHKNDPARLIGRAISVVREVAALGGNRVAASNV